MILLHPTGNENVKAAVNGLNNYGLLEEFYTSIAVFPGTPLHYLGNLSLLSEIKRRSFEEEIKSVTHTYPTKEIGRLLFSKVHMNSFIRHEDGIFSIDAICRSLDKKIANKILRHKINTTAVYAYEDCAQLSFIAAKAKGFMNFYDLPIGYWRTMHKLLASEKETNPGWASTLTGFRDSQKKLARKDDEIRLADHIFVASTFTAKTLEDYPGNLPPVSVIPYGFPEVSNESHGMIFKGDRKLKILFVGGLSQRKGLSYLLEVADKLQRHIDLTIVGQKVSSECEILNHYLNKHTWIASLPHSEVLTLMKTHDVLVFPSLFEGFGLVISEAMSQGVPVVTTERTAGPDIIQHGENGWIVESGNTQSLLDTIEQLLYNPKHLSSAGKLAKDTASKRPWSVYGNEIAVRAKQLINNREHAR